MAENVRARSAYAFRRMAIKKPVKTLKLLGAEWSVIKTHIENKFTDKMGWENYGRKFGIVCWEIDHVIPLSSAKTENELVKLCHYENLQPLWQLDNLKKSNKILESRSPQHA